MDVTLFYSMDLCIFFMRNFNYGDIQQGSLSVT